MNTVSLIGNLATEVELRDVGEDKKVAGFLLAVNRGNREAGADFVWVKTWDRQAELCAEYLTKGQRVGVAGRLHSHSWEEGKRRTLVEVVGQRIDFLSGPPRDDDESGAEVIPFEAAAAG
ncbi:MAG TPA: single-stranded DNA-binding protein [Gaiellaceae bacterium]